VGCSPPSPSPSPPNGKPDYTLRIGTGTVELAPDRVVSTVVYNGQFPGPLLRFKQGQTAWVDIHNDTDTPEQLHWHGQQIPVEVDGAAEEGTPYIPPTACDASRLRPARQDSLLSHPPRRTSRLGGGQYSGQVGPVYIEPKQNPGAYDRKSSSPSRSFSPLSASRATWTPIYWPATRTPT